MNTFAIAALQLQAPNADNTGLLTAEIDAVAARFPWLDMVLCPELGACGTDKTCAEPMPGELNGPVFWRGGFPRCCL